MDLGAGLFIIPLLVVVLVGLGMFFIPRKKAVTGSNASDVPDKPNWTPVEAVAITIAAYFVTQFIAGLIISAYLLTQNQSPDTISDKLTNSVGIQFGYVFLVDGLIAWLVYVFIKRRKTSLRLIGLIRPRLKDLLYASIGYGAYFVLYMIILTVVHIAVPGLDINQKQELGFDTGSGGIALVLAFISLVVLPPLVEEFVMRGFLFSGLRGKLKFLPAAIITSILFAVAHLQAGSGNALLWIAAIDTFILSMVLVTLREKTGSLWPGIGLHAIKNGLAFIALFVLHLV
jgi:membrane protease YdiL (CAAX protease family)